MEEWVQFQIDLSEVIHQDQIDQIGLIFFPHWLQCPWFPKSYFIGLQPETSHVCLKYLIYVFWNKNDVQQMFLFPARSTSQEQDTDGFAEVVAFGADTKFAELTQKKHSGKLFLSHTQKLFALLGFSHAGTGLLEENIKKNPVILTLYLRPSSVFLMHWRKFRSIQQMKTGQEKWIVRFCNMLDFGTAADKTQYWLQELMAALE